MSNNINFSVGRAVNAAISHVENNELRFTNTGMWSALRDPSLRRLIEDTDPFMVSQGADAKRLLAFKEGTTNPRILLNYTPATSKGYRTSRTAAGGSSGSNGVGIIDGEVQTEIVFNKHHEFEIIETLFTSDIYREPATIEYLNRLANPALRVAAMQDTQFKNAKKALGRAGYEIYRRLDADLVTPINADLITSMAAKVGKNAAYPVWDTIGGTEDAPVIQVNAFESDGVTPCVEFWDALMDTQRMNRFTSKPLVVGGNKLARYMQKRGILSVADTGFDLNALLNLPIIWYYDAQIDTIYGQDQILAFDNGAACLQTYNEHSSYALVPVSKQANMYYGQMAIDIVQLGASGSVNPSTYTMNLDFRALELTDSADYPANRIVPSARYGVYGRPVGFFTDVTSDIMNKVTGIFAFKLNTKS